MISIHCDYHDELFLHRKPCGAEWAQRLCRDAKEAGVDAINFRVEACGTTWVTSPLRPRRGEVNIKPPVSWLDPTCHFVQSGRLAEVNDDMLGVSGDLYRKVYEQVGDPLQAFCCAARQHDIRANVYICPYDQYWPGAADTIIHQHPDKCITSRDGRKRLTVPSLAYPENREWLLTFYDSVLERDVDDVVVYQTTHSWKLFPRDTQADWFGFEEPAVRDYRDQTGIDVRTEPFDIDDYYRHYGTYWSALIEALARRQQRRGRRLIVGCHIGDWEVYFPIGGNPATTWRHYNEWRKWTALGNVDVCVGHQTDIWTDSWPTTRLPYVPGGPCQPPYLLVDDIYGPTAERDFNLYACVGLHADKAEAELETAMAGYRKVGLDGLIVRETANLEFGVGWDAFARARRKVAANCEDPG